MQTCMQCMAQLMPLPLTVSCFSIIQIVLVQNSSKTTKKFFTFDVFVFDEFCTSMFNSTK